MNFLRFSQSSPWQLFSRFGILHLSPWAGVVLEGDARAAQDVRGPGPEDEARPRGRRQLGPAHAGPVDGPTTSPERRGRERVRDFLGCHLLFPITATRFQVVELNSEC